MTALRLAITPGEPGGIGPDLALTLAQLDGGDELVVIADPELLRERARQLGLTVHIQLVQPGDNTDPAPAGQLNVLPVALAQPAFAGRLNTANGRYVLDTLDAAIDGCRRGQFDALITGPVHKGVINEAGIPFSGHTEYLAARTDTAQVVMMLATEGLRVALATTHLPLKDVASAIDGPALATTLRIVDADLRHHFAIARPRILVCGLNPHAGEGGHLGTEERDIIEPVLAQLRTEGLDLVGPLPADTLFTPKYLATADAVLAMYHDQGLPVLKYKGFGRAVNITLGLPIIRTSVDHGTALDLAGSGRADSGSLYTALEYARTMARARREATA